MVLTSWEILQLTEQQQQVVEQRNPYDLKTWGSECARGVPYATTGAPVKSGTKGVVRKISTGRKARGSSSADLERKENEAKRCS